MKTNEPRKNDQLTDQDRPTGLMGTQFALNIAQGVLDAIEEAQVSKSQMLLWDQKELRVISKKVTQKFLNLMNRRKNDPMLICMRRYPVIDHSKKFAHLSGDEHDLHDYM